MPRPCQPHWREYKPGWPIGSDSSDKPPPNYQGPLQGPFLLPIVAHDCSN